MSQTKIQSVCFVCYAKVDEQKAQSVFEEINSTLEINYVLWSYRMVGDVDVYYEQVVAPAIEKADFVLFLLTKEIENDELARRVYSYCHNLNKSMIPLKIDNGRLRLKEFEFRTEVADFYDRQDKVNFLEQMHSWLGLVKIYPWSSVKFCSKCGKKVRTEACFCKWCGKQFKK